MGRSWDADLEKGGRRGGAGCRRGSAPAGRVVGAVSDRAICGSTRSHLPQAGVVGSPKVGCHFLDGIPGVRQSGAMQIFSDEVCPFGWTLSVTSPGVAECVLATGGGRMLIDSP